MKINHTEIKQETDMVSSAVPHKVSGEKRGLDSEKRIITTTATTAQSDIQQSESSTLKENLTLAFIIEQQQKKPRTDVEETDEEPVVQGPFDFDMFRPELLPKEENHEFIFGLACPQPSTFDFEMDEYNPKVFPKEDEKQFFFGVVTQSETV